MIEVRMGMTVREFIERNHLQVGPWKAQEYVVDANDIGDWMPIQFTDHWIALHVLDAEQSFELPPGRTLHVSQEAGRISGVALRPFAQPRLLDEMREYIVGLLTQLEAKGWQPTLAIKVPSQVEDFDAGGKSSFADMKSPSGNILQMNLRDYGLAPKQESFIFKFDPNPKPAEQSRTYLLQVTVDSTQEMRGYGDLIYPRRIFESGDVTKPLPLRYWLEDPDWTPEKAGMIPTKPEERSNAESSKWKMPPR
ncbi:hypothetical protein E2F50_20260 [Rhizobium deserti]|uniref:Uncharacterized protein n=1 Tax=Rhizobium deserti TaxID=2547961 RepID=A0A4R5U9W1_9HYPH|nr:hypothetical protein [Rhizobium deserti]TDK31277.1 hypothetical protein E2F50_20260 [Rhizobium deserti]